MVTAGLLDELDEDLLDEEDFVEDDDLELLLDLLDDELLEDELSSVLDEAEDEVTSELEVDETTAELDELDELEVLSVLLSTGVMVLDEELWDSPPMGGLVCLHG